ncbi:SAM-dependent methyltransferase [Mycobacterium sp. 1274761.0]|uniref:SAM-dependent methyltransferase n=1 Tax=Mycobacterium sp. 1274761.0 TaxID=1834077 RepID=UPI000801A4F3|nr:SAM-dependent methyltransferase [Mycobacterium sp. 1274761.0]OBK73796.1 methyltransferase [Mycobacterium sp. 1274761.0]
MDEISMNLSAVADTGVLVAAIRAHESSRETPLFVDPFARRLAGDVGMRMLADMIAEVGEQPTLQIVVRTRFFDEALLRVAPAATQVVLVAAGLDARSYRLPWSSGTTVYELDQPAVIAAKDQHLAAERPRARRVAVGVDLTVDWASALTSAGHDAATPTIWLVEGLLQYLDEPTVRALFSGIDSLSAPGSVLLYDVVGKTLLESAPLAGVRQTMAERGSPWLFGTDEPGELAEVNGWDAVVTDVAEPGHAWGRWPAPAAPRDAEGVPRGYFVEAVKPVAPSPGNESVKSAIAGSCTPNARDREE